MVFEVDFSPMLIQFFDLYSDRLINEKIDILTVTKEGKQVSDVPNFYDILEQYQRKRFTGIETSSFRRCFSYHMKNSSEFPI